MLFTVNVTLFLPLRMSLLVTVHWPLLFVVHEDVPLAPLLHAPVTVAFAIGL